MNSNWENFHKTTSVEGSIISNPWDNTSNNGNIMNLTAPNPVSPIMSHTQTNQPTQSQQHDDVASIISGLSGVALTNGQSRNVLQNQSSFLSSYKPANNLANLNVFEEAVVSESGSDAIRDAISAISAPVATQPLNKSRFGSNIFGPASIAGGNVTNLTSSALSGKNSTFLEKFASVTEKTRELESSNNLGSRRSSMFNNEPKSPNQFFREPRKQSFSEKLESYISATASPSASRHLSFSSDVNNNNNSNQQTTDHNSIITDTNSNNVTNPMNFKNNWNPATAATFHPSYPMNDLSFMQQQQMMMHAFQMGPQNPFFSQMFPPSFVPPAPFGMPPNMVPNPSDMAKAQDMKLTDTTRSEYGSKNEELEGVDAASKKTIDEDLEDTDAASENKESNDKINDNQHNANKYAEFFPVGINNRPSSPYVMAPFNPYGMFASSPSGGIIPTPTSPNSPNVMLGSPQLVGMVHVNPSMDSNDKSRIGTPNGRHPRSPNSNPNKKNSGKSSKFKNKHIVRSPLLEEFRNNKDKTYTLDDIASHGYEFAKDQHGSRFIQQELSTASDESKEVFFKEIRTNSMDLMTDVFGNYVIQKYFEFGTPVQKKVLFELMRGSFNTLSLQMYGCRVVQRCLEGVPLTDQLEIMEELKPNILNLVKDQNGNHVIQKAIEKIPIDKIPFVLDSLRHQIYHLSMHPYGCRVIQRLLECSNVEDQEFILNELEKFIYYLVQDQFGNYVIQHVIESGKKKDTDVILKVVLDNLIELSKHKFASNAVEKCIINLPVESRIKIYETMLKDNLSRDDELDDSTNLMLMIKDPFANYVVQKMVELIDTDRKKLLVYKIRQYLKLIQKNTHGKHLASIEKLNHICRAYDV